jgi:cyclomaltodextrinase / maltogenic alpha-amylase / neopullulanase
MTDILPEMSPLAKSFKPGVYKHFKGDLYEALFVARNSESRGEEFVVYRSIEKGLVWIRPIEMFFEQVEKNGYSGSRFIWVSGKTDHPLEQVV